MSLRSRLGDRPVMVEVIPPGRRASEKAVRSLIENYVREAVEQCEPDAINVPEIVDENYRGDPFYRNMDPRSFCDALRDVLGEREVVVNKIVAHCKAGPAELERWATSLKDHSIQNVIAVGGASSKHNYPGPTVPEANRILREAGLCCGNIMIPERRGEARRMLEKTVSGAEFFTTQAVFTADRSIEILRRYQALCKEEGVKPAAVFVSFAPVADGDDLEFLSWLGSAIPPEMERRLLAGGTEGLAMSSIQLAEENWRRILSEGGTQGRAPLGINVEYISRHNFGHAVEMGKRLSKIARKT